jgi:hypothetical protein
MFRAFVSMLLFLNVQFIYAQTTKEKKRYVSIGASYSSNMNFYGRTDSVSCSGFSPYVEVGFFKNASISLSPTFISDAFQTMAYSGLSASFDLQKSVGDWYLSGGVSKSFYTNNSYLTQSVVNGQLYSYITYFNDLLNLSGGADVKISDRTDYVFNVGLDHSFVKNDENDGTWLIDPTLNASIGTHQFSRSFLDSKYFGIVNNELSKMRLLSTELSVPILYLKGPVFMMLSPAYVVPMNLLKVGGVIRETGKTQFFLSATLRYKFNHS